eukprot:395328-Prorocentrum_minimum.AAC.2
MGAWDFDFAGGYKHIPLAFNFGGVRHRKYVQSGSRTWLPVGWAYIRSLWSKGIPDEWKLPQRCGHSPSNMESFLPAILFGSARHGLGTENYSRCCKCASKRKSLKAPAMII